MEVNTKFSVEVLAAGDPRWPPLADLIGTDTRWVWQVTRGRLGARYYARAGLTVLHVPPFGAACIFEGGQVIPLPALRSSYAIAGRADLARAKLATGGKAERIVERSLVILILKAIVLLLEANPGLFTPGFKFAYNSGQAAYGELSCIAQSSLDGRSTPVAPRLGGAGKGGPRPSGKPTSTQAPDGSRTATRSRPKKATNPKSAG